jgi:hypothetical protein
MGSRGRKPAWLVLMLKLAEAAAMSLPKDGTSPVPTWASELVLKVIRVLLRTR